MNLRQGFLSELQKTIKNCANEEACTFSTHCVPETEEVEHIFQSNQQNETAEE